MKTKVGFTLVELLIVIVVIAILAAISIVAYNGIQDRASDTKMRAGISQIDKAIKLWHIDHGELPVGGWGSTAPINPSATNCTDGSGGWLTGSYICTFGDVLRVTGNLPADFVTNLPHNTIWTPTNKTGRYSVMLYRCGTTNNYALFYHLRRPTATDTNNISQAESQGCPSSPRTAYGMRGVTMIRF